MNGGLQVPENSSICMIDPELHKTNAMHAIMSGGLMMGYNQTSVYGLSFDVTTENTVETINCNLSLFMPML
jgi:tRNA A37 threonylcarbamoyladenosine synthetase subunit TsaC/SUA5/YrdC